MMQNIALLGSTGSIGTQTLQVAALHPDRFRITALVARRSREKLFEQVRQFRPLIAGLTEPIPESEIPADLRFCRWVMGPEAAEAAITQSQCDKVLVAVVGIVGLPSVLTALANGKEVLLANKETLVAGGNLVTEAARRAGKPLLPVDSEHSAIFQCLQAAGPNPIKRLLLTASGGPFRTWTKEQIESATPAQALKHPNWSMGAKVTIDSASMFNKALEVVEARWLFDTTDIQVLVHPQSIVHSAVEFADGGVIAQLGVPDMRLPILYAMTYPERCITGADELNLFKIGSLTFEEPDPVRFPALRIVRECLAEGGAACCMMNAANEVAVDAFLKEKIPFGAIPRVVETALTRAGHQSADTLEALYEADALARRLAGEALA